MDLGFRSQTLTSRRFGALPVCSWLIWVYYIYQSSGPRNCTVISMYYREIDRTCNYRPCQKKVSFIQVLYQFVQEGDRVIALPQSHAIMPTSKNISIYRSVQHRLQSLVCHLQCIAASSPWPRSVITKSNPSWFWGWARSQIPKFQEQKRSGWQLCTPSKEQN